MKVQATGSRFKIFVDGDAQPAMDLNDDHFSSGMIGVRDYGSDGKKSLSSYSNLLATELGRDEQGRLKKTSNQ